MSCFQVRTDLALEARESIREADGELRGVIVEEWDRKESQIHVTKVQITTKNGSRLMNKPIGTYLTLEAFGLAEPDEGYHREVSEELARQLRNLIPDLEEEKSVLVVGLGNRAVTADALGPKVADNLLVTRHVVKEFGKAAYNKEKVHAVSAIVPGVMAATGMERVEIVNGLRSGEFDVLVGINLLREGLDMPEVELVCILDADKEGFLRSEGALIQTIGRAARNSESKVIMYADRMTDSMKIAIDETNYRREKQQAYNIAHNVKPQTIKKDVVDTLKITMDAKEEKMDKKDITKKIEQLKGMMSTAASQLDFETAIKLREEIAKLKRKLRK